MTIENDSTIDQVAHTITACVRYEIPDSAITAKLEEITKAAEERAAELLRDAPEAQDRWAV